MAGDRFKGALTALARRADPLTLYRAMYRARLVNQSADLLRLDVAPDDPLLPLMSNVPLRHGIPGLTVSVAPGAYVLVGWDNGKPDAPFAALWANPNQTGQGNARGTGTGGSGAVLVTAVVAHRVDLGKYEAADAVIKGTEYRQAEQLMNTELSTAFAALALAAVGPLAPLKPGFQAVQRAIDDFEGKGDFLSEIVRTG